MYKDVKISPLKNNSYRILDDISYKDITVPEGYITNGADIPRVFWSFFPPNKSDYLPAVIIHDYLCDAVEYKKADDTFEEVLKLLGVGKLSIFILVSGVRIAHKLTKKY